MRKPRNFVANAPLFFCSSFLVMLSALLAGCVMYRPSTQAPSELAYVEEVPFVVTPPPAIRSRFAAHLVVTDFQFGVNGVDGATRIL